MPIEVLDPTHGDDDAVFALANRPARLEGLTVGVISNGKQGTIPFFEAFAAAMQERHGVAEVVRVTKANYSAPAEAEIVDRVREWHALVAGVGD